MATRCALPAIAALLAITGCSSTPQIQTSRSEMAMAVKSKVPVVVTVDYSPDGTGLATGGVDGTGRIWDVAGARQAAKFREPAGTLRVVRYTPDGKAVAVASRDHTTIWDVATGTARLKFPGNFGGKVSFSPDGRTILGYAYGGLTSPGSLELRDVSTGAVIRKYDGEDGQLSPDGKYVATWGTEIKGLIATSYTPNIKMFDAATGRLLWRSDINTWAVAFSPDSREVLVAQNERNNAMADQVMAIKLLETQSGRMVREFGKGRVSAGLLSVSHVYQKYGSLAFSPDGKRVISGDLGGNYKLWDVASGELVVQLKTVDELAGTVFNVVPQARFSPDGRTAAVVSLSSARVFDMATGRELATLVSFEDGEWLITTPDGYYSASDKGDQYLSVSVAGVPYSISQARESLFRPDLVKLALSGRALDGLRKIADVKPPPAVAIVDTPASVGAPEADLKVRFTDQGGGVGDVRVYLNGTAVILDRAGGRGASGTSSYKLRLVSGKNSVRVIAFNADNTMQSADALHEIDARVAATRPSLHAIVIGIQEYENPKLTLMYPAADAALIASSLRDQVPGLFERINVVELKTRSQTSKEAITGALKDVALVARPEDMFVFFVASHGTVDDGQYFLITSNVGSTSTHILRQSALSQDDLKALIANVPATKKLVLIDTCNAGKLGEAIQVAVLTRGMSEDTALKILSRAVGSTVISASTSLQEALEGYKGHGLFTWVVANGLKGAADGDKDGFVKTHELVDYVDSQVPELAETLFKHKQYPTTSLSGQGYPVVRVR